jgi:TrbL/VirB6 plasmid conjugal transfer protein
MAVDQAYVMQSYQNAVQQMSAVGNMWNPFQLIYVTNNGVEANQWASFITSMVNIGILVLLLMATFRFVSILMDEMNNIPAATALIGVLLEIAFVGLCLWNYTWFAEIFPGIFQRLTNSILDAYRNDIMTDAANALGVAALEKTSESKWFSLNISLSSFPQAISNILGVLALAMTWIVSIYQAALYTLWYLIGPILIPFFVFRPLRGVAVRWFRSLLAVSFMGVVGSVLFMLIQRSGWMMQAFASGHNNSYVTSLVFSAVCLLLMFSIPALSSAIFSGIEASLTRGAMAAGTLFGAATASAVVAGGSAAYAAGRTTGGVGGFVGAIDRFRGSGESNMSMRDRVVDAVRHRGDVRNPGGFIDMIQSSGDKLSSVGSKAIISQLPTSLGRLGKVFSGSSNTPAAKAREVQRGKESIRSRIAQNYGEEAAKGLSLQNLAFTRRPGETFEDAVNRNYASVERGQRNASDANEIQGYIAKHFGEEEASRVFISPKRDWNLPKDDTRIDRVAQYARQAVNSNRLMSDVSDVRKAAESIVGQERANKIDWSTVRPLKELKATDDRQEAISNYAMTLLYKARAFTPEETRQHDHAAIRKEIARKLGPDKAAKVIIPDEWRVAAKRGQPRMEAIRGSTVALLQQQGLIDKAGDNTIAEKHSVRSKLRHKAAWKIKKAQERKPASDEKRDA